MINVKAAVIPGDVGLTITFSAIGEDEDKLRSVFDVIKDTGDVSKAMSHILSLAAGAVELIEKNKERLYL